MSIFSRLCVVVTVVSLLFACEKDEPSAVSPTIDSNRSTAVDSTSKHNRESVGDVKIILLPESPTADDDLYVAVSGGVGGISYRWERNGEIIDGAHSDRLSAHSFVKGDTIILTVHAGATELQASTIIGNLPPEIISVAFADPEIGSGKDIVLLPEGVDPDGDELTFRCVWAVNGEDLLFETGTVLPADNFRKGDRISVQVIPDDGRSQGKIFNGGEFIVPNSPPVITSEPVHDFLGQEYFYKVQATDPDGDPLSFRLESAPPGMTIEPSLGEVRWSIGQSDVGEHQIRILTEDTEGMRAIQEYTLTLSIMQ